MAAWWQRWLDFRTRQRARLDDGVNELTARATTPTPPPDAGAYGAIGRPLRQSPFLLGLGFGLGLLVAYSLWQAIGSLDTVLTLLVVAVFLALALDPLVRRLVDAGRTRGQAVALTFAIVLVVLVVLGWVVIPPVVQQGTELARHGPERVDDLLRNPQLQDLDSAYHLLDRAQEEIGRRVRDGAFMSQVFGGVLGAGKALASGLFSALTVLVLTLYFLASLPAIKRAAYASVPASRRARVESLSEEIMRRVGSYAIGQVLVATTNAVCSYLMMKIVGIPYAAVLAVSVGLLGLVPMVGATLGAVLVALVALFVSPGAALIVLLYYLIYQQIENYVIAPRIMQRTVAVPGGFTVVAALVGGTLAGVLGALLAIPAAAGLLLLWEEVLVPRQQQH